tara:strand:+ start:2684 stop:3178 length:495 start_codon:yes stop_codon:yes gene_type:complete
VSTYPRSIILKDLTAKFCRISGTDAPVNPFGSKQWEMVIQTSDADKVQELKNLGLNVKQDKEDEKTFNVNLKRKGIKADGNPNAPVKIVDSKLQPLEGNNIGNGSKVNVNLWQYEYEAPGRKGVATSLTAVQVVELVEYTPTAGFEVVGEAPAEAKAEEQQLPF